MTSSQNLIYDIEQASLVHLFFSISLPPAHPAVQWVPGMKARVVKASNGACELFVWSTYGGKGKYYKAANGSMS